MLSTRVVTAALALPLVAGLILFASNGIFAAFIALCVLAGLAEAASLCPPRSAAAATESARWSISLPRFHKGAAFTGAIVAVVVAESRGSWPLVLCVGLALALWLLKVAVSDLNSLAALRQKTPWLACAYVGAFFPYFALLRNGPGGVRTTIGVLGLTVVGDTAAYLVGSTAGRVRLAPRVSPAKTLEGAVASMVACVLAALATARWWMPEISRAQAALVAVGFNLAAQIGDLVESALKRTAGVKDSGVLFPGHGGLLDRTDSLAFATVFTYYCISLM